MNLYEWEGKKIFRNHGIVVPRSILVRRGDNVEAAYKQLDAVEVVVKAQVLSGKRGKNNGIVFCQSAAEVGAAVESLFNKNIRGQYVAAVLIEEKIDISEEHYLAITYNTATKEPMIIYSRDGGGDIEEVAEEKILRINLDIRQKEIDSLPVLDHEDPVGGKTNGITSGVAEVVKKMWQCFLAEDARLLEINPLVKTITGNWVAVDAKVALDEDAFYRHETWKEFEPRTMLGRLPTEREIAVRKIDEGEGYYRGTAGKYIEMDGDIAILFSGGGASIANMDALLKAGLRPANYTEYSGNPPREKVYALAKVVLSKPGLRGLWIAGGVANFTNIAETFHGIVDALEELKPDFPIVVRRAGPYDEEGMRLMKACAVKNNLNIHFFGKETSMSDTATALRDLVKS